MCHPLLVHDGNHSFVKWRMDWNRGPGRRWWRRELIYVQERGWTSLSCGWMTDEHEQCSSPLLTTLPTITITTTRNANLVHSNAATITCNNSRVIPTSSPTPSHTLGADQRTEWSECKCPLSFIQFVSQFTRKICNQIPLGPNPLDIRHACSLNWNS